MADPLRLHYATQLYRPEHRETFERFLDGLRKNLELQFIERATLLLDQCEVPFTHEKLRCIPIDRRATFSDFLELVIPEGEQGECSHLVFANTDIVFDDSLRKLAEVMHDPRQAVCLTRREVDGGFPKDVEPMQSQDAWMIRCHEIHPLLLDELRGIKIGMAGCEHVFAAAMLAYGYNLWNPSLDCLVHHSDPEPAFLHRRDRRYLGLFAYVPPCSVEDIGVNDPGVFLSFARSPGKAYSVSLG